jgi:hypothetical protein
LNGGKLVPTYQETKNTPYRSTDEKNIYKQNLDIKNPEYAPFPSIPAGPSSYDKGSSQNQMYMPSYQKTPAAKNQSDKLLVDLQVYQDQKKGNPLADKQARLPIEPFTLSSPFIPPQFSTYLSNFMKNFYTPFIYKDYHINIGGPTGDSSFASVIYEDAMPALDVYYSFKTLRDRNNLVDYIRGNFIKVSEGELTNFEGKNNSLISRLKLITLNPFDSNTFSANPYYNMPKRIEVFSSCYPIVAENSIAQCKKNSVGIIVRIFGITKVELIAKFPNYNNTNTNTNPNPNPNPNIPEYERYNIWREIKYYEYIRLNINKGFISPNFIQSYCFFLCTDADIDYSKNSNLDPSTIDKNKLLSSKLNIVLLTESPNKNLIQWTSDLYSTSGGTKQTQIYSGFKPVEVWEPIIFQMLTVFYLMDKLNFTIRNMTLIDNFYIKDVHQYNESGNQFWIYRINNIDYYVPCKGDLLMIDSNYKDNKDNKDLPKIISSEIFKSDENTDVKKMVITNAFNCFDSNIITSAQNIGTLGLKKPPDNIISLFDNIRKDLMDHDKNKDNTNIYETIMLKYFSKYLHNRIGTMIRDNEKDYIKKDDVVPFKRGDLVIYESKYETYEILLYLENKDEYTCECVTRTNRNNNMLITKSNDEKININKDLLHHYSNYEQIRQDVLPGQPAQSLDYLIETYII